MSVVFSMAYKAWKDSWTSPHTLAWADTSWTMVRARTLLLVVTCCCCAWLRLAGADDSSLETRSSDFPMKTQQEKELVRHFRNDVILCYGSCFFSFSGHAVFLCCSFCQIDALQEVLEKLRSKEMPLEKKLGWLPSVCISSWVVWKGTVNEKKEKEDPQKCQIKQKGECSAHRRSFYSANNVFLYSLILRIHVALVAVWCRGAVRRA